MPAFKFIHASDLHLDSQLHSIPLATGEINETVRLASRLAFRNMIELALRESVDFIFISGDIYDGDWPDYSTGLFFIEQIKKVTAKGVKVFMVSGNHDAANVMTRKLDFPEGMVLFSAEHPETRCLDYAGVAVHGQSYRQKAVFDNLARHYPRAIDGYFNIGLLHTGLSGCDGHAPYAPCSEMDLSSLGYDYWALGHSHTPAVLRVNPHIVYAGNIQGRHIRETGQRGCYLGAVDDYGQIARLDFVPTSVIIWEHCLIRLEDTDAIESVPQIVQEQVESMRGKYPDIPLAVRVTLEGNEAFHKPLTADADYWRHQIAVSIIASEPPVWLEKIILKINRTENRSKNDGPLQELLQSAESFQLSSEERSLFLQQVKELWSLLPNDMYPDGFPYKIDGEWHDQLIEEAAFLLDAKFVK